MDLTTRCPNCGTVFQACLTELQLRKGYIRCVQCSHIFDGYAEVVADATPPEALAAVPRAAVAPPRPAVAPAAPAMGASAAPSPQVIRSGRLSRQPSEEAPAFSIGVAPWPDDRPEPRIGDGHERSGPRPVDQILADEGWVSDASVAPGSSRSASRETAGAQAESFMIEARPGHRSQGGSAAPLLRDEDAPGWGAALARFCARLLLLLLLILLAAQAAYVYRADIARMAPALRPVLERACAPLHCRVPYGRDITLIAITGSALKAADSNAVAGLPPLDQVPDEQRFELHATLRNRAEAPQEWPTLALELKDAAGTQLVRRNLSPADYLGAARAAQPFAGLSEVLVRVPLTLSGVRINGYQLDLFYP